MNRKSKKSKKTSWFQRHILAIIIATASLLALIVYFATFCFQSHDGESKWVYVPVNATTESLHDSLKSSLGNSEANRIYALWRLMGGEIAIAHGAYKIDSGENAISIARRLSRGMQTPVKISFSNARTLNQLAEKVTARVECSHTEFLEACNTVLSDSGFKSAEFTAAFLPDTYEAYWTSTGIDIAKKLLRHRNNFWNEQRRNKAKALGLTPVEVASLAAIVEEESAKSDERPKIARLYLNRLEKGMPLQADPTVKFAVGDFGLRRITGKHLSVESPYNTYIHAGLTPGPIRIATAKTIDQVLDAPRHPYIYMCAKEDFSGYHNFAVNYAEHMSNARKYQAELNRRNIH